MKQAAKWGRWACVVGLLALGGCVSNPVQPNRCIAFNWSVPTIATLGRACAVQLTPEWAVSVRHADNALVGIRTIVDPDYDLLFFKWRGVLRHHDAPIWGFAKVGETVIAEGNPESPLDWLIGIAPPNRHIVSGPVVSTDYHYCGPKGTILTCTDVILFEAAVKPGYSGGPVVNQSGVIVGITSAGVPKDKTNNGLGLGIALPSSLVMREFVRLVPTDEIYGVPKILTHDKERWREFVMHLPAEEKERWRALLAKYKQKAGNAASQ